MKRTRNDPVTIRGVTYDTAISAAESFGLTVDYIMDSARKGRADYIGIPSHKTRPPGPTIKPYPVMVRGMVFESAEECAKVFGIGANAVRSAVAAGRTDFIGRGKDRKHSNVRRGVATATSKPFSVGPFHWPSQRSAALALGISLPTLRRYIVAGDTEYLLSAAMRAQAARDKEIIKEREA